MKTQKALGPLEHQIMDIVWIQQKSTVYSVVAELSKKKKLAYTTVMTVMTRLAKKGVLSRQKKGKTYFYMPSESKDQFIHDVVKNTISKLVDMFGDEALIAFEDETKNLSDEQKEALLSKIDAS